MVGRERRRDFADADTSQLMAPHGRLACRQHLPSKIGNCSIRERQGRGNCRVGEKYDSE